jgi:hypothetical protein
MPTKSAAYQKKVKDAVQILEKTTGVSVPQAMILDGFLISDATSKIVRQVVRRRRQQKQHGSLPAPANGVVVIGNEQLSLSEVTDESRPSSGPTNPKPKRKHIRPTAFAIQQHSVDDLKVMRHKSDVHKAAMRLYDTEMKKPNGMSIRQVQVVITSKYDICPSAATISRYATNGLIDASPKKMGPAGHISALAYKFLCRAYASLTCAHQPDERMRRRQLPKKR